MLTSPRRKSFLVRVRPLVAAFLLGMFIMEVTVPLVYAEDSVDEIQNDIEKKEKALKKAAEKKAVLERNLGQINSALSATIAAISKTQAALRETENTLERKQLEIQLLGQQIELKTEILTEIMQDMYFNGQSPEMDTVLGDSNLSVVTDQQEHYASLQERVQGLLDDIQGLKMKTEEEKINLEEIKEEKQEILEEKADEKQELASDQAETKQDIQSQAAIIERLKKELAELQGDLSALTGKSYDAKDIRDAVEFASGKTGVPKGVLYGFLKKETNLGANTGQCTYDEVEKVSIARYKKYGKKYQSSINLLYKRKELFNDLVKELGYNKNKKVSCSPSAYIGQGGAMGVPQFMSDVWQGYESRIAAQTGHKNPDPWNLTDGVMAMALKLRAAGATSDKESVIKKASISYLGTFNKNYYEGIVYWSKNYKSLFQ